MRQTRSQLDLFNERAQKVSWEGHPIFHEVEPHIFKHFLKFHTKNPKIYELFKRYSYELINAGREFYGAKSIMERIRWHVAVETVGDIFKISNSVTSCYPRLLIIEDPVFEGFFRRHKNGQYED